MQTSIEGRAAVEMLDPSPDAQKLNYAFKCHREGNMIYPVNAVAFHPNGTFATGGCDKQVITWDGDHKKRLSVVRARRCAAKDSRAQIRKFQTSVAALSYNVTGDLLAVAVSYTYEEGDKPHPADAVVVHTMQPQEFQPRA